MDKGYYVAKGTLRENFGLPHIIAKAHIKKLEDLPPLKQADGASLLEYARHLDVANRTLSGMGPEYVKGTEQEAATVYEGQVDRMCRNDYFIWSKT